jgi:transcriptional regulator with XRE-family HTH domain
LNYRKIIDQKGLKHKYIAEKIGVSKAMLSLFLSGQRNLSQEKKMKLNKILNIK